jgi:hypothetical protein
MLRISIPPTTKSPITFADFINYHLPIPSKGLKANNKDTVLLFDNEYEAVVYADQLEEIVTTISKSSPLRNIVRDMATAIRNDDTIRNYLENSTIFTWLKNCMKTLRYAIKPYSYLSRNKF